MARVVLVAASVWLTVVHPLNAPTSFAGTWVSDPVTGADTAATAGGMVSARGGTVGSWTPAERQLEERLAQTADTLTIERRSSGGRQKYVYNLDGTESANVNGRSTRTTKSRWDGDTLITEGQEATTSARGAIVNTFREVRSIDNSGTMIVEATRQFEGSGQTVSLLSLVRKK